MRWRTRTRLVYKHMLADRLSAIRNMLIPHLSEELFESMSMQAGTVC